MSIQELSDKFKWFLKDSEYQLALLIIVVSLTSFYLGRVSMTEIVAGNKINSSYTAPSQEDAPYTGSQLYDTAETGNSDIQAVVTGKEERYVASKSGTKYHLPWCPGVKQMKEANKIYFATKEEAEKAGYSPASNCKGI